MDPHDGRVVSNFIVQALMNKPITIYGDGMQTRFFCYVDDLVEGFVRMMSEDGFNGPVNLGNPGEFTVRELAEKILGITGSKSRLLEKPLPADDPRLRRPDFTPAQQELDWIPRVPPEAGLLQTIRNFDELLGSDSRQTKQATLTLLRRSTDKPENQASSG